MVVIVRCALLFLTLVIAQKVSGISSGTFDIPKPVYKFEGILGSTSEIIENQNSLAPSFLPYNPTVIEIGSDEGAGTITLAATYPYGRIFAFEPHPRAFAVLQENVKACKNVSPINRAINNATGHAKLYLYRGKNNTDRGLEHLSSLLPIFKSDSNAFDNPSIMVPCVNLDDWCQLNHIDHVDFLRIDAEGLELQILENSQNVLKKAIVIVVKTNFRQLRENGALYPDIKQFLEKNDFEMLAHWYCEDLQGEATFVRKAYYDSIFR